MLEPVTKITQHTASQGAMLSRIVRGDSRVPANTAKACGFCKAPHAFAVLVRGSLPSRGIGESMPPDARPLVLPQALRNTVACVALILLSTSAIALAEEKKDDKPEPGFTSLFNGKDLDGWHIMNKGQFSVRDQVIFLNKGGGWLRSDKQYKDFELRMDFRFIDKGADSGIFVRAGKEGRSWPDQAYQVQTMDNDSICSVFPHGKMPVGKQKKDAAKLKKVMKPTGEWQAYVFTAKGPHLEIKLNGEPINVVNGLADRAGYIGMQGEGGRLEFRNIRIKEFKENDN